MKYRCDLESQESYQYYGGRGITYDAKWASYLGFLEDMGEKPEGDYSLDRIDTDGHYCKANCRWADSTTQSRNRRNNVQVTHDGRTMVLSAWAEETGIPYATLYARIVVNGWDCGRALNAPVRGRKVG